MVNNCATFVILILGWFLLSERASLFSVVTLAISFVGTVMVLLGEEATAGVVTGDAGASGSYIVSLLMLLCNPIIIGAGMIAMR